MVWYCQHLSDSGPALIYLLSCSTRGHCRTMASWEPFQHINQFSRYRYSKYKYKTVLGSSYLYNENLYAGTAIYLYWDGLHASMTGIHSLKVTKFIDKADICWTIWASVNIIYFEQIRSTSPTIYHDPNQTLRHVWRTTHRPEINYLYELVTGNISCNFQFHIRPHLGWILDYS